MTDYNELKKLAEAASPGPWRGDRYDGTVKYCVLNVNGNAVVAGDNGNNMSGPFGVMSAENESYILAANPATVLSILAHISSLEQRIAELEDKYNKGYQQGLADAYQLAGDHKYLFDTSKHACNPPMNSSIYYFRKELQELSIANSAGKDKP